MHIKTNELKTIIFLHKWDWQFYQSHSYFRTISEMMIITMMGFPPAALPILTIIATIIDPPATMLNVVGDTSSSMLVSRIVDGKNWLEEKEVVKEEVSEEIKEETKEKNKGTKKTKKRA